MRLFRGRIKDSTKSTLVAGFFAISQLIFPFLSVMPVTAADVPLNETSIASFGFVISNSSSYTEVAGVPTAAGSIKNGNVGAYVEGACIPSVLEITNNSDTTGDILVSPVFDYLNNNTAIEDLETVGDSAQPGNALDNPRSSVDNLNDFTYPGSPLSSTNSFEGTNGLVTADISGPYAGNNASTSPTTSGDTFRHYNVELSDVDADETVYLTFCARLGLDSSEYNGSSLSIRTVQGGQENIPIPVNALLRRPSLTIEKVVEGGSATASDFTFNVSPAIDGQTLFSIPSGESSVFIDNIFPDGTFTITENVYGGYVFDSGTGTNCTFDSATATATLVAAKSPTNAECQFTNRFIDNPTVTVIKALSDDNDGGTAGVNEFGLTQNDVAVDSGQTVEYAVGDSVSIDEAGLAGYEFVSITGTDCPSELGGSVGPLAEGQDVVCTITNDDIAPTLTLEKTVKNDNGGNNVAADWTLTAQESGESPIISEKGTSDGNELVAKTSKVDAVAGVAYDLSENGPAGYTASDWTCEGGDGDELTNATVTLELGENVVCKITNDDKAPQLTLIKDISLFNNNGPAVASDFILHLEGGIYDLDDDFSTGDTPTVNSNVTYTLSEDDILNSDGDPGYELNRIECVIDGTDTSVLLGDNKVSLSEGQSVTCTFFNDDIPPKLTVTKVVNNNYGGDLAVSNFPLFVDDGDNKIQVVSGDENEYDAGLYVVSETQQTGYKLTSLTGDCNISGEVTLEVGGTYSCTFTNEDVRPTLTLVKDVVNDYGEAADASLWTLSATPATNDLGATKLSGDGDPTDGGGVDKADAYANVAYTLDETDGVDGYTEGSWDCDGGNLVGDKLTLNLAEDVTCTITNTAQEPALTIVKKAINDDGGEVAASAFVLKVNGVELGLPNVTDSVGDETTATWNYENVQTGTQFTVTEVQKSGYEYKGMVCEDDDTDKTVSHPVTLAAGQSVTCTLTNDDISPSLTLVKKVVNDDGGEKQQDAWTLTASGPDLLQGVDNTESLLTGVSDDVEAGTYALSESGIDGYELTSIVCDGETLELDDGTAQITLGLADDVLCVFTNDDIAPVLRLVKETETINENPSQVFELYVEQDDDGLTDEYDVDTDETNDTYLDTVVLNGDDGLMAGDVTVGEVVPEGWALAEISCSPTGSDNVIGETYLDDEYEFTLKPGDDVTCTFVNVEQPDIKVTKYWDVNQNGEFDEGEETLPDWTFKLAECVYLNGVTPLVVDSFGYVPGCDGPYTTEDYESALVAYPVLTQDTDETGSTTFENLSPFSHYTLSEVLQEGWNISGMTCEYEEGTQGGGVALDFNRYFINPYPGETVECYVGNYQDTQLFIEKTNNRIGDDLLPGDSVVYTITVSNPEDSGIAYENVTYDILPEGVSYTAGTWTAVSDVRGSIAVALDEGSDYASDGPATWELGDIAPGETVTLTYAATVDAATEPGTYENVAWNEGWACEIKLPYLERPVDVRAEDLLNVQAQYTDEVNSYSCFSDDCEYDYTALEHSRCRTYGNLVSVFAQDESDDDPFVESAITVVAEEDEQGFVLGVLSVTGVPAILPTAVGLTLVSAALLLSRAGGNRKQRRWLKGLAAAGKNLLVALVMTLAFSAGAIAAAPWQLNVVDLPDTIGDNTPQISYTVAAADAADTFTVELYQNTDLIETQNITSAHGGSGQFNVPEVADGDYDFSVLVTNNNTSATKEHTEAVVIDTDTPSAPVYEGVERSGNTYTLNFTVPSGDVNKVRIYASTNTEFELNGSNLVRTLNVTPGEDVETTYIAPDSQQRFFAVVAVDSAGNTSAPSGDSETVVVDSQGNPVTTGSTNNTGGTTGGDGDNGGAVLPDQDDTGNGDDANDNGTDANGDAADTTDDSEDESTDDDGTNGWFIALLVAAILGMGYYYFGRNSER